MKCKICGQNLGENITYYCNNCGKTVCEKCGIETLKICPNCYHDLELK